MNDPTLLRHDYSQTPVYRLFVYRRPSGTGKGKDEYISAVKCEAKRRIEIEILADDIEIAVVYSTKRASSIRSDIDNVLKPTLDAMKGVVFDDDRRVRAVSARLIDRNSATIIMADSFDAAGLINSIYAPHYDDVVIINVYSLSRTQELGGFEIVQKRLNEEAMAETERIYRMTQKIEIRTDDYEN